MEKLPRNYRENNGTIWFKDINTFDLVQRHDTPLRVNISGILTENFVFLKNVVEAELQTQGIPTDKFKCGYAIKANQSYRLVSEAVQNTDFIEASSMNDLILLERLSDKLEGKTIICHGFKTPNSTYYNKILSLFNKGVSVLPVIDSIDELHAFTRLSLPIKLGLRVNADIEFNGNPIRDRFGLTPNEIYENLDLIISDRRFCLLHMHVANTMVSSNRRLDKLRQLFDIYKGLIQRGAAFTHISTGGGLPERSFHSDKYFKDFYRELISDIKTRIADIEKFPTIMNESGRFLAAETQFLLLEVILEKKNNRDFSWYLLNGSSINLIPERMLDEGKSFQMIPIHSLDAEKQPVVCVGITCDPEDFFHTDIRQLPIIPEGNTLHLLIPNTGAYQESLLGAGRNLPGHCLIDSPHEITINTDGLITENSSPNDFTEHLNFE